MVKVKKFALMFDLTAGGYVSALVGLFIAALAINDGRLNFHLPGKFHERFKV
jgi:hypothetical protein